MIVKYVCNYFLLRCLHKVQPIRLTGGLFEGEVVIPCLYVVIQGVIEVGGIFWIGLGYFFMVEQHGHKISVYGRMNLVVDMATYAKR